MQWADLLVVFSEWTFCLSVPASLLKWVVYGRDLKFQMIRICFSVVRLSWNWHHTIFLWAINIQTWRSEHIGQSKLCVRSLEDDGIENLGHQTASTVLYFHNDLVKMTEIIRKASKPVYPTIFYKFHVPTFSTDSFKNLYFHRIIKAESDSHLTICWINCVQWLLDNSRNGK